MNQPHLDLAAVASTGAAARDDAPTSSRSPSPGPGGARQGLRRDRRALVGAVRPAVPA